MLSAAAELCIFVSVVLTLPLSPLSLVPGLQVQPSPHSVQKTRVHTVHTDFSTMLNIAHLTSLMDREEFKTYSFSVEILLFYAV